MRAAAALAPFAAILAFAACAAAPDTPPGSESTDPALLLPSGGRWTVTAIEGEPVPARVTPTLARDGDRVGGNGGCNQYGGGITIAGERLSFGQLVSTMMACPSPAMEVEGRLHAALARVDGLRGTVGGVLQLTEDSRPVVTLTPAAAE